MRERALKVVLVVVGLLFIGVIYPLVTSLEKEPALAMMLSLYVTLGVFLLLAVRNPAAYRHLIAFAVWSSFAHGAVMAVQAYRMPDAREHLLIGTAAFGVIGVVLIALAPRRPSSETRAMAA